MKEGETDTDIGLVPSRLTNDRALVAIGSSLICAGPYLTSRNISDCQFREVRDDTSYVEKCGRIHLQETFLTLWELNILPFLMPLKKSAKTSEYAQGHKSSKENG